MATLPEDWTSRPRPCGEQSRWSTGMFLLYQSVLFHSLPSLLRVDSKHDLSSFYVERTRALMFWPTCVIIKVCCGYPNLTQRLIYSQNECQNSEILAPWRVAASSCRVRNQLGMSVPRHLTMHSSILQPYALTSAMLTSFETTTQSDCTTS